MKKLLLTLCVSIALCGSLFAQYGTHWPEFNDHAHALNKGIVAYIQVNGTYVDETNWEQMEVAAFVGEECRGTSFMVNEVEMGDEYPSIQMQVYYDEPGELLTFQLYDHLKGGDPYTVCTPMYTTGELVSPVTGTWYTGIWDEPDTESLVLCFTGEEPSGIDLNITPYTSQKDHYYLIASPVGNVLASSVTNLFSNSYDLYYFNQEQDKEWINYVAGGEVSTDPEFASMEGKLMAGRGYLYANSGDDEHEVVTLTFPGDAYTTADGTATFELEYVEGKDMTGWNLIGNPFNTPAFIYGFDNFYVMNDLGTDVMESSGEIAPMQGIFVLATAPGTVTFSGEESDKVSKLSLNLVRGNKVIDRASVSFGGSSLPKFQINRNSTKVYIPMDGEDFAVVSSEEMGEMPVNFKAENNGSYTLAVSTELSFSYLHLIDNMTGADVDLLATPSYSFDALTTDYASRFRLVFATGSSVDGDSFSFVNAAGNLCIFGIEGEATLQVMDVTGRILGTETFSGSYEKQLNVAPGVYMLRLTNGNNVKVQKMVVR